MSSNWKKSDSSDHESSGVKISPALNQLDPYFLYILENRNLEDESNVLNELQELKVQKSVKLSTTTCKKMINHKKGLKDW